MLAVLGQLHAKRNWHQVVLDILGEPPATELGRLDAEFWKSRGWSNPKPRSGESAP